MDSATIFTQVQSKSTRQLREVIKSKNYKMSDYENLSTIYTNKQIYYTQ